MFLPAAPLSRGCGFLFLHNIPDAFRVEAGEGELLGQGAAGLEGEKAGDQGPHPGGDSRRGGAGDIRRRRGWARRGLDHPRRGGGAGVFRGGGVVLRFRFREDRHGDIFREGEIPHPAVRVLLVLGDGDIREEHVLIGMVRGGDPEEEPVPLHGLGTYLLKEAEKFAKENGASMVMTNAGDWNVAFFKKNGYLLRGELKDVPKGHNCYELYKMI